MTDDGGRRQRRHEERPEFGDADRSVTQETAAGGSPIGIRIAIIDHRDSLVPRRRDDVEVQICEQDADAKREGDHNQSCTHR